MDPQLVSASQAQTQNVSSTPDDVHRRSANFSPSIWGDYFLAYDSMETADTEANQSIQELMEEVKRVLMSSPPSQRLDLIDYVQRLGVSYHFENEIDQLLQLVHNRYNDNNEGDLNTVALRFRLLRQQGFKVSCNMFNKFIDVDGKFKKSCVADVVGLLSLYEATHLRTHGEEILDQALFFTTTHLESAVAAHGRLSPPLSKQVAHALYQPLYKGNPRIEARHYLSSYQELNCTSHFSQSLLNFAKLDFNQLQRVHQRELSDITRWWKELDFVNKLPFARDRIVECYFWSLGVYFEPKYHFGRKTNLCKVLGFLTMIDDTYDMYGTPEELEAFTEAVQRWDISAMDSLPNYMKICYQAMLNVYIEIEDELAKERNSYRIKYAIEAMKSQVRAYFKEAIWFHQNYTPGTFDEYMSVALVTSGMFMVEATFLVATPGDTVTRDFLDWLFSCPKFVKATDIIGRLLNDIRSHKFEQKRGHVVSAVECYMREHCVTEEEAVIELSKQVDDAWKDLNEGLLHPIATGMPRPILLLILDFTRVTEIIYKYEDGYTHGGVVLKDYITCLLVEPVPI